MATSRRRIVPMAAGAVILAAVIYAGVRSLAPAAAEPSDPRPRPAAATAAPDPAQQLRLTLDPRLFQGEVRKAYEVARRDPALLAQLHCYCGCDHTEGHTSLLDCFRDKHGSTCAICVGEAVEADTLSTQGMPVEQIRDALRARYAGGG
jgi:hypothetical protein